MRALLIRFAVIVAAVFLVSWGLPQIFKIAPPIDYGDWQRNWSTLLIFSAILTVINTFIRPILKLFALPITCLTLGLFGLFINVVMFFLAAMLTGLLGGGQVQVGWAGALIGAVAVWVVSFIASRVTEESVSA